MISLLVVVSLLYSGWLFASLVGCATGIRSLLCDGAVVDPTQEFTDMFSLKLLDRNTATPFFPFPLRGLVFRSCSS